MRPGLRHNGVPLFVLVVTLASAIAGALVIHAVVQDQERRLLHERGGEVAAVLTTSVSSIEASLPLAAGIARLDPTPDKRAFAAAAHGLLTPGVQAVAVLNDRAGAITVDTALGKALRRGQTLHGPRAVLARRALHAGQLVTAVFKDAGGTHAALAVPGPGGVSYQESTVNPTTPIPSTPDSPYSELAVAVYAAPRADPSKLLITSTGHPLTGGTIDRRVMKVGADRWLVESQGRRPLVGSFASNLHWVVLAVGLLAALLSTALAGVLARRQRYAVEVVDEKTAELRETIEEKTNLEAAALEARAIAEAANRAKSEFLSRMSHELRTPLNAILGFGQLLELDGLDDEQQDSVDHILKGGRHLLGLVDEILDISRIEAGTMAISVEPVELPSAIGDVLRMIAPLAADRRVELISNELPAADQTYVLADRMRLRQVLLNVLSNAVKYNREDGWVKVTVEPAKGGNLAIRVADSGPGIAADKLDKLFTPFERLGAELGKTEGTGLGLALTKGLLERMGGSIRAESKPGEGAVFIVELEQAGSPVTDDALEAARVAGQGEAAFGSCTLLYIEDNLSNFRLVERLFASQDGIQLIPAGQGRLGLELAASHQPDLILLDLHLPDIPGQAVFESLQLNPATRDLPVVVVSADATDAQVKRLLDAGAVDYLTKPLDLRRFLEVVRRYALETDPEVEDLVS